MNEKTLQEIETRCRAAHDVGECGSREESVFHAHATGDMLALIAALREAWADKERFDWLEANSITRDDHDTLIVDFILNDGESFRDAVDAARKA